MLLRTVAWQQSVKSGAILGEKEMQGLISSLFQCRQPNISPSGKPTYLEFKKDQLEKMFIR
jgi:DNA mismatch repair protein MutL